MAAVEEIHGDDERFKRWLEKNPDNNPGVRNTPRMA
jgi:hypothetical protein